jgi:hypothetical protein
MKGKQKNEKINVRKMRAEETERQMRKRTQTERDRNRAIYTKEKIKITKETDDSFYFILVRHAPRLVKRD